MTGASVWKRVCVFVFRPEAVASRGRYWRISDCSKRQSSCFANRHA